MLKSHARWRIVLINPRLPDFYGIAVPQASLDFAIPFFNEDIPLYVDPFLLWRSPSQADQGLHTSLTNAFNHLGYLAKNGGRAQAIATLVAASECDEVGLGSSTTRLGKRIGVAKAGEIIDLFERLPLYREQGFRHFEAIQFFIEGISKDRISDITCSFIKSFLIDFTIQQCNSLGIPLTIHDLDSVYNYRTNQFESEKGVTLPSNPQNGKPLILVPKRWLRFVPWIAYNDYFRVYCPQDEVAHAGEKLQRVDVLNFNRKNFDIVESYVTEKERTFEDCHNDPLFSQIPILSAKRRFNRIKRLPSGKDGNADREYENVLGELLPSLFYPHLDFAAVQSRTDSGAVIRDLIFYNGQQDPFLKDIAAEYGSRQLVFEMKNVKDISRDHVNQLNRYMTDELGKFGILVTRNPLSKARMQSTVDLWAGQRRCIVTLDDADVEQMVELFDSRQRGPIDVLKKKYVSYRRMCPG
jgi:hypothetical protein